MNIDTKSRAKITVKITAKLHFSAGLALLASTFFFSQHAAAGLVDLKWNEQGQFQHSAEIKAGGFLEVCGKLPAGLKIDWQYKSQQALDFNIHYHEGKKLSVPVKHQAKQTVAEQFEVKVAQDYCWMWSNKSKEATTVDLSLHRVAQ
ncbi:hypothetical protein [Undibacterium flavidum]|uniref:Uncharacterized protein n=1 Tax=Undibacterium flavidum TaxID=2762297 RepID=A0ABR6Y8I7_9BURK|nr:hypothetical protein [Undibacterium flavidum]MBC3872880.1 hypothetical protein [Undibacterium flavidum]